MKRNPTKKQIFGVVFDTVKIFTIVSIVLFLFHIHPTTFFIMSISILVFLISFYYHEKLEKIIEEPDYYYYEV